MTFRFVEEHREQWPVRLLCDTLEVSTAGYYAWRDRPTSARQERRDALVAEIRAVHAEVKARYGSPRIHAELAARGRDCCVNTVAKLMRDNGIRAKTARKFRQHDRLQPRPARGREPPGPPLRPRGTKRTLGGGRHVHPDPRGLAVPGRRRGPVLPRVVGWSMADHMQSRLVVDALELAVQRRLPDEGAAGALRPRQPVRRRTLSAPPGPARHRVQHEPARGLLGQRPHGELFRLPEEGIDPRRGLRHAGGGAGGDRRLHRGLLQHQVAGTPRWGTSPRRSTNRRNNR